MGLGVYPVGGDHTRNVSDRTNDLVEVLQSFDRVVLARAIFGTVHQLRQPLIEHFNNKCRLAAPRNTCYRNKFAKRDPDIDAF